MNIPISALCFLGGIYFGITLMCLAAVDRHEQASKISDVCRFKCLDDKGCCGNSAKECPNICPHYDMDNL